jgi:hypothetical protein
VSLLLSTSDLKARGWTEALIREHLGQPDGFRANPVYRSAAQVKLYGEARVTTVQQSEAWAALLERAARRKEAASRATDTKRERLMAAIAALEVCVPVLAEEVLTRRAIDSYNNFQMVRAEYRQDWGYREASVDSDPCFIRRISVNHLRHSLTRYEAELETTFGKVGVREAYVQINRKVYQAIGSAYPALAEECDRQMKAKEQS